MSGQTLSNSNLNDAAKAALEKKRKRKVLWHTLLDGTLIYLSIVAGVTMTESALDIQETKTISFFNNWSWARLAVAAVIAAAFMTKFEVGGDLKGKRKNMGRRLSHAFGQGAALRGAIEWLALLFTLTR